MINSDFLNGYTNKKDSIEKMIEVLEEKGIGEKGVQYKMKDWPSTVKDTGVNRFRLFTVRNAVW